MGIKLEKITVRDCGPIKNFDEELTMLNLVHSRNEGGKSYLVEFIIKCLFKSKSNWGYLREAGTGRVTISGLDDKLLNFSTGKGKKIENYLEEKNLGLPPSIVKLFVVKGGETQIGEGEAGIDKNIIKNILSQRRILDSITKKISNTIRQANITDDEIVIKKTGEGKEFHYKKNELNQINEIINRFTKEYEQGELKELMLKKEDLRQIEELLLNAKRYKAYKLYAEIKELKKNANNFPEDTINELNKLIREYETEERKYNDLKEELEEIKKETKKIPDLKDQKDNLLRAKRFRAYSLSQNLKSQESELKEITEEELIGFEQSVSKYKELNSAKKIKIELINELKLESENYEWLKSAKANYYKFLSSVPKLGKRMNYLPIVFLIFLFLGLATVAFDEKIFGILLLILSVLVGIVYVITLKKSIIPFRKSKEFESMSNEFKIRFGSELKDVTQLESLLSKQEKNYNQLEVHQSELEKIQINIKNIKRTIEEKIKGFDYNNELRIDWDLILSNLKKKRKKLLYDYQEIREELAKLDVDESDYELSDPGIKYSKSELDEIDNELNVLEGLKKQENKKELELNDLENHLEELDRKIKSAFKKIVSEEVKKTEWENRITHIEKLRDESLKQISNKQGELRGLGISEIDYEKDNPGKEFNQSELDDVEIKLKELDQKVKEETDRLSNLKASISSITGADISTNWSDLIYKLYIKKEQVTKETVEIETKIISGIVANQTIKELQQEEDLKLIEGINSEEVKDALFKLTVRYKELSFEGTDIVISDEYSDYLLKDLSTGAKEQVMLALRIGFLKKMFNQVNAFLILDDAFQHSDYEKRPILINTLFELAKDGWQIIYLTMDDNIRDLFRQISRTLSHNLKEITLN